MSDLASSPTERYKNQTVAQGYDARRFGTFTGRLFNMLERRLIRRAFAGLRAGAIVVDVPCGTGRLADILLELDYQVCGADISPAMLDVAQGRLAQYGTRFRPMECDALALPQQGTMFDASLCARLLFHFPMTTQVAFLRAIASATRERVVFTHSLDTPFHRGRRAVKRMLGHRPPARYPVTPAELQSLIQAAGLKEIHRFQVLPVISEAMVFVCTPAAGGRLPNK